MVLNINLPTIVALNDGALALSDGALALSDDVLALNDGVFDERTKDLPCISASAAMTGLGLVMFMNIFILIKIICYF